MTNARAAYNFVPLSYVVEGEPAVRADRYHADRHTGWFEIEITTLTPTYTRGAVGGTGFPAPLASAGSDAAPADFFHRGDEDRTPIMPGSSLRGMFRGIFEIMSHSRSEATSDRRLFYRFFAERAPNGALNELYRANFPMERLQGGILKRGSTGWQLEVSEAANHGFVLVPEESVLPGQKTARNTVWPVHVEIGAQMHGKIGAPIAKLVQTGGVAAFLVIPGPDVAPSGGARSRKYFQAIVAAGEDGRRISVPDQVYADYLARREMVFGRRANSSHAPQPGQTSRDTNRRQPRMLTDGQPAFALLTPDGSAAASIGANMMMHIRYSRTIREVVDSSCAPNGSGAVPAVDMASRLFGRVSPDGAIRSRVFVDDAVCSTRAPFLDTSPERSIRVPAILAAPKPTAIQMYLTQDGTVPMRHWSDPEARVRGYKLYWHRSPASAVQALGPAGADLGTQKTRIVPVRDQVSFEGRIRFENLSDAELGGLYAAVQLPDGLAHRFGMGKSLGLGSVRVQVTHVVLLDMAARYHSPAPSPEANVAGKVAEDRATVTLRRAYAAFVQRVSPAQNSLWAPRPMRALAALLSWDARLADDLSRHASIQDAGSEQWKDRSVLPDAAELYRSHVGEVVAQDVVALEVGTRTAHPSRRTPTETRFTGKRACRVVLVELKRGRYFVRRSDGPAEERFRCEGVNPLFTSGHEFTAAVEFKDGSPVAGKMKV